MKTVFALLALLSISAVVQAVQEVRDDEGNAVRLASPASRIVSLAPHTTELLFAAGAGEKVVGVVSYSDFPEAARTIQQVGSYQGLDLERVLALKPDLVVAWSSGNGAAVIDRLRKLGLTVYVSEPRRFEDIANGVERLGRLAGSDQTAERAAKQFRDGLNELRKRYARQPEVRVFYQVWNQPLMTVGGPHLFTEAAAVCGGSNVFGRLNVQAPTVDLEAVLAADPEVIIAGGMGDVNADWLTAWRRLPQLTAVRQGNLVFIHPDLLQRPTPRLLEGTRQLCRALEQARSQKDGK